MIERDTRRSSDLLLNVAALIEIHGADALVTAETPNRQTATFIVIVRIQLKDVQPRPGGAHEHQPHVCHARDLHHKVVSREFARILHKRYDHARVAGIHQIGMKIRGGIDGRSARVGRQQN